LIKLSDNFEKERNLLILNSFLIFLATFTNFNGKIKIPLFNIDLPITQDTLLILLFLNIYFIFRFILEWIKSDAEAKKEISHKVDFYISFLIGISSIVSIWYNSTSNLWIWNTENLLSSIFLLIVGIFVSSITIILIEMLVYIRSEKEACRLNLPRIPYALKAQVIWIPINIIILIITWFIVKKFMNENMQSYWYIIILFPFVIHSIFLIPYFLFPNKERRKTMKFILDQHEVNIFHADDSSSLNREKVSENIKKECKKTNDEEYQKILSKLKKGFNPNEIGYHGWTPFMLSVANKDIKLAKLYIEYGADVNAKNLLGRTAILFAIRYNSYELV